MVGFVASRRRAWQGVADSWHRAQTIIGKKDVCPFCAEKVNLREMFTNPWESQSIFWANLLDAVRYLMVWNPLIVGGIQFAFYVFGLN